MLSWNVGNVKKNVKKNQSLYVILIVVILICGAVPLILRNNTPKRKVQDADHKYNSRKKVSTASSGIANENHNFKPFSPSASTPLVAIKYGNPVKLRASRGHNSKTPFSFSAKFSEERETPKLRKRLSNASSDIATNENHDGEMLRPLAPTLSKAVRDTDGRTCPHWPSASATRVYEAGGVRKLRLSWGDNSKTPQITGDCIYNNRTSCKLWLWLKWHVHIPRLQRNMMLLVQMVCQKKWDPSYLF